MFEKFQMAVRNAYLDLKNEGRLHFDREWPSPGELKSWCLKCHVQGLTPDDELVFMRFFNRERSTRDLATIIEGFDLDKLRPLRNFISGDTQRRPDENIVKLLAILVDFKPRPYKASHWDERIYTNSLNENKEDVPTSISEPDNLSVDNQLNTPKEEEYITTVVEQAKPENSKNNRGMPQSVEIQKWLKNKTLLYAGSGLAIVIILCGIIYSVMTSTDCMCWDGNRYVEVDCQDIGQPYQIVGLDKNKLAYFQKITLPDTLDYEDIGKVWYSKINNEVEFFTYPGHHPIQYGKSLKAVTKHIIDSYTRENIKNE